MTGCVFCDVISGAAPAHRVWEDHATVAFLDRRPLFHGHVLLVPRIHVETLADLPPDQLTPLFGVAQRISTAVVEVTGAQGSFVAMNNVVSQSVPHLHVHIVPRTKGDGLRGFFWPRTTYADDTEAADVAERINRALEANAARD